MDIAFFCPKLSSKGGAEIYLTKVAELLAKRHDVIIYTMKYDKQAFPEVKGLVKSLGMPWLMKRTEGKKASTLATINAMKRIKNKISKSHELYNMHLFPSNFISNHKPMVWTPHEPSRMLYDLQDEVISGLNFFRKLIPRTYFPVLRRWDLYETNKNVDRIIANSIYSKNYVKSLYGKPVTIIYPGIDEQLFKIRKKKSNMLLSVGRLYSTKRVDLIIKSFKRIVEKNPETTLEIVGSGPMELSLKLLVKGLKLTGKVKFKGEVSDKELINSYSKAKAVFYYPLREMFGMVPLEAMATGTPVVAVNQGGFTEVVKNSALLTKPEPAIIANKINDLLSNRTRWNRLSIKGRKVVKKFTWKKVAKQTEQEFKKLI